MRKCLISEPMDFKYKEGHAVDFQKTFDLTGNENDEMLRMYLRKAGLSDNIDCLNADERRAYIYDIVTSNKYPGHWKPSVLPQMNPNATMRSVRSVDEPCSSESIASIDDIPPASMTFDYSHYSTVGTLRRKTNQPTQEETVYKGTLYERQFSQQKSISTRVYNTPPTPPSPSTLMTRKGRQIEISGPTNFKHISGDMTRDMSKNAFDLSGQYNDNFVKKYLIEHNISDQDVEGMDNKELIRLIVQSKFTWMPLRKQYVGTSVPPPPSQTYVAPSPVPSPTQTIRHHSKGGALVVKPPTLPPNNAAAEENIYLEVYPPSPRGSTLRRPVQPPPPVPSPVGQHRTKGSSKTHHAPAPPPPPSVVQSANSGRSQTYIPSPPPSPPQMPTGNKAKPIPPSPQLSRITAIPPPPPQLPKASAGPPPPAPPPPPPATSGGPPPPPPMPTMSSAGPPPPPPPAPMSAVPPAPMAASKKPSEPHSEAPRDALLESIRAGVTLKKVNKTNNGPIGGTIKVTNNSSHSEMPSTVRQKPIKAEQPDFMSELRNATLKRIKKLENNPHAEINSESQC